MAEFFDRAVGLTEQVKAQTGGKVKDFKAALAVDETALEAKFPAIVALKKEVVAFAQKFPTVGF